MDKFKIKQIIPAPNNMYVVYEDDEEEIESKIVCIALWGDGDITLMDVNENGEIHQIADNVKKIIYK